MKTGVVLKLPTHRMVRWDVGKGIKKVSSQSPVGGRSYGRWRDRPEGRHGDIVQLMRSSIVNCSPHTRMPKKNAPCECSRVLRKGLIATTLAEFGCNRVMMEIGLVYHRWRADLSS